MKISPSARRIITSALIAALLMLSAGQWEGCCMVTTYYRWTSLRLTPLDNTGSVPVASTGPIVAQAFALRVDATIAVLAALHLRLGMALPATAQVDCGEDAKLRDTATEVRITRIGAAGDTLDVTDDFVMRLGDTTGAGPLEEYHHGNGFLATVNNSTDAPTTRLDLFHIRNTRPASGVRFAFTIRFSNGAVLADTTAPLTLE